MKGWGRPLLRAVGMGWLLGVLPLDLAVTFGRLLPRLMAEPAIGMALLLVARVVAVSVGIATGMSLWRRGDATRALAGVWVVLEAATLLVAWTTTILPTNRPPGALLPTAALYLAMAAIVWMATAPVSASPR